MRSPLSSLVDPNVLASVVTAASLEALRAVQGPPGHLIKNTAKGKDSRRITHQSITHYARQLSRDPTDYELRGYVLGLITLVMDTEAQRAKPR